MRVEVQLPVGFRLRRKGALMERRYDAYCGLYCGACYIMVANRLGTVAEDLRCFGCKTNILPEHCAGCEIRACAAGKGIPHCGECPDFPCKVLDEARKARPHLGEIHDNCREIKKAGIDLWLERQAQRWTCPDCGTPFSWYTQKCSTCGRSLSGFASGGPV
jgi:hypothetical protein